MEYLLDSNLIIDYGSRYQPTIDFLRSLIQETDVVFISTMTEAEIFAGRSFDKLDTFIQEKFPVRSIPIDSTIARKAGALKRGGTPPDIVDALIAATAIVHDLVLVTRNIKHFMIIPNLKLTGPREE